MELLEQVITSVKQLDQKQLLAVQAFVWRLNGLEDALGHLAMKFRSTWDGDERKQIVKEYAEVVDKLIATGGWCEVPAPEDQLPDACMPAVFRNYWDNYWIGR